MRLARPGLQALKQSSDIGLIGMLQEPVAHRDILDFTLDAEPASFLDRRRGSERLFPFIERKRNVVAPTEPF